MTRPKPAGKSTLRQEMIKLRAEMTPKQRDAESFDLRTLLAPLGEGVRTLAAFHPLKDEIDILPWLQVLWAEGRSVLLPRVEGPILSFHPVISPAQLALGTLGIPEPRREIFPDTMAKPPSLAAPHLTVGGARHGPFTPRQALMIVPGLAFGADGRRLGYGRGYYDGVLSRLGPEWITVGVGYSCQRSDDLPEGPADRRVDGVLLGGEWVKEVR